MAIVTTVDISIFIRTKNEAELLPKCLAAIFGQKHSYEFEVILLDSGSTDTTLEIAGNYPVRILTISQTLFSYSATLNAGIAIASGRFFVPVSAHAVPHNENWLKELIEPLISSEGVIATFSRQVAWPDASIPEMRQIRRAFPEKNTVLTPDRWKLSLSEKKEPFEVARLSNVSAAYRREFLLKHPFRSLPFSEDRCMGIEILEAGGSIQYVPSSIITHSHTPDFRSFRRVARAATVSRYMVNATVPSCAVHGYTSPSKLRLMMSSLKIPAYVVWLSISSWFLILQPRRHARSRELLWKISSLGTTFGKQEGVSLSRRKIQVEVLPIADPAPILAAVSEQMRNSN